MTSLASTEEGRRAVEISLVDIRQRVRAKKFDYRPLISASSKVENAFALTLAARGRDGRSIPASRSAFMPSQSSEAASASM